MTSSGRDVTNLLARLLEQELEVQQQALHHLSSSSSSSSSSSASSASLSVGGSTADVGYQELLDAREADLGARRELLLERLDVLQQADEDLLRRFTALQQAMSCTTPELDKFWAQVWLEKQ
mgnify:CR=1 FL=1